MEFANVSECLSSTDNNGSTLLFPEYADHCNHSFSLHNESTTAAPNVTIHEWVYPLGACIFLIIDCALSSSWIVLANIIVISSFLRDSKLRLIQNYYIVSLAISDFMMGAFVMPLGLYQFLYQAWPSENRPLCKFWNVLDFTNSLQSSLSICLISYDRYKMVLHPIAYRNEESPKRALFRIACSWTFSILFYFPVVLFWDSFVGFSVLAVDECDVEFREVAPLTITQAFVEFLVPLVVICFCNLRLLMYIRQRRRRLVDVKKALDKNHGTTETTLDEASSTAHKQPTKDTEKKQEEKAKNKTELQEIRKETRATRSLLILVGTYFCLWFWYEIIGNFVDPICKCVPTSIYMASYWPQYHISGINPLIYAVTIERFRYHFKVFFSYVFPCCVGHPDRANTSKVAPSSVAAVHSASHVSSAN